MTLDCFAEPVIGPRFARTRWLAMTTSRLMIISRHADLACDVVVTRRELHAGAGRLLADRRAIELLPRRLVGRVGEAALGLQVGVAAFDLVVRDQDVGRALVE